MADWKLENGRTLTGVPDSVTYEDLLKQAKATGSAKPVKPYDLTQDAVSSSVKGASQAIAAPYEFAKSVISSVGGWSPPWWLRSGEARDEALRRQAAYSGGILGPNPIGGAVKSMMLGSGFEAPRAVAMPAKDMRATVATTGLDTDTSNQGLPGRVVEEVSAATLPLGILGGAARVAPRMSASTNALVDMFRRNPRLVAGAELTSAVGAGAGGYVGRELTDSDYGEVVGQVAGGTLNLPSNVLRRGPGVARRVKEMASMYVPGKGQERTAAKKIQQVLVEAGEDPLVVAQRLKGGGLSPAQATDSEALLTLERAAIKRNPGKYSDYVRGLRKEAADDLRSLVSGNPEDVQNYYQGRMKRITAATDMRVQQAAQDAEEAIRRAGPEIDTAQASEIYSAEMERAYGDLKALEKAAWDRIDPNTPVITSSLRTTYEKIIQEATEVKKRAGGVLPKFVRDMFDDPEGPMAYVSRFDEVKDLRSTLGDLVADEANRPYSRNMQRLRQAALEDMTASGEAAVHARQVSQKLNETFREGTIGRLRGKGAYQKGAVAPEAALEVAIGQRSGDVAAVKVDELMKPNIGAMGEEALRKFVRDRFRRAAIQNGKVNVNGARKYVANNRALLDRFPGLEKEFTNAATNQRSLDDTIKSQAGRLAAAEGSPVGRYITEKDARKIERALQSNDPVREIKSLARHARRDDSGMALAGLKKQVVREIMQRAETQGLQEGAYLDALAFNRMLRKYEPALMEVMSKQELGNLVQISKRLRTMELQAKGGASLEEMLEHEPDMLYDLGVRALGANIGSASAAGQATGAPLVMAGYGSRMAQRVLEKVPYEKLSDVIEKAIFDQEFMKLLLEKPTTAAKAQQAAARLNAFLVNIIPQEE